MIELVNTCKFLNSALTDQTTKLLSQFTVETHVEGDQFPLGTDLGEAPS